MSIRAQLREWTLRALRIGASVGLVIYALHRVDLEEAWQLAGRLAPLAAAGAIVALVSKLATAAERWLGLLRHLGAKMNRRQGLAIFSLGNFLNQALPSSVGGYAARVWLCRRAGFDIGVAARSVALDLIAGFVALLLMMLAATPLLWRWAGAEVGAWVLSASLLGLALFAAMLAGGDSERGRRFRIVRAISLTSRDAREVFLTPRAAVPALGLSFVFQASQVLAMYALARGLGVDLALLEAFVLVPVVLMVITLPISVGGWGVREVGLIAALGVAGVQAEAAAVVAILFGLFNLGLGLLTGAAWLGLRKPKREALEITVREGHVATGKGASG